MNRKVCNPELVKNVVTNTATDQKELMSCLQEMMDESIVPRTAVANIYSAIRAMDTAVTQLAAAELLIDVHVRNSRRIAE